MHIEGLKTKLLLLFFGCVFGERRVWKENKKGTESLHIKHSNFFLKNKFSELSSPVEGQNLSGWF